MYVRTKIIYSLASTLCYKQRNKILIIWDLAEFEWDLAGCGWDVAEWGGDLAECEWDLAEVGGWDLAEL